MNYFIKLCAIFIIGGTLGYILELFFRRIVHKKWINPGFLTGPCLPLYGIGTLALFLICSIDYTFISSIVLRKIFVIFTLTILLTLIEYIAGIIFIKALNIKLWDYSNRFGNIKGIICPTFSLCWGLIGAIYYLFLHNILLDLTNNISNNITIIFLIGIYLGIFIIDIINSFNVVTKIRTWAIENDIIVKYEELKTTISTRAKEFKQKRHFILFFKTKNTFLEELEHYKEKHKFFHK